MFPALAAGASHPLVAGLLGLGAAGLAGVVVAMAWSVHTGQIRLAETLARRQYLVTGEAEAAAPASNGNGSHGPAGQEVKAAAGRGPKSPVIIEGPDTVVAGAQARYRVKPSGDQTVVSWAAGGGAVAQSPDPAHPEDLLLVADRPGDLAVMVRVREGMMERRGTKSVTAVPEVTTTPPFTLRLFLQAWSVVVVAVLVIGLAGSLVALGTLSASDFIALTVPLAALLGVVAVARGADDSRPSQGGTPRS
jgi:hypothetical protein